MDKSSEEDDIIYKNEDNSEKKLDEESFEQDF